MFWTCFKCSGVLIMIPSWWGQTNRGGTTSSSSSLLPNLPCPRIRSGWGRLFAFGGLKREVGGQSWYLVVNSTSFSPLKPNRTQFSGRPYFRAWVPALVAMESEYESFIGCNNCHRKGEPWLLFTFFIPLLHLWNRKVFFFEVLFL